MYLRAYSRRNTLDLGTHELSVTREEIQGYLLNVVVGLASMAIALFGGEGAVAWAGWIYLLIFPLQAPGPQQHLPPTAKGRKESGAP